MCRVTRRGRGEHLDASPFPERSTRSNLTESHTIFTVRRLLFLVYAIQSGKMVVMTCRKVCEFVYRDLTVARNTSAE